MAAGLDLGDGPVKTAECAVRPLAVKLQGQRSLLVAQRHNRCAVGRGNRNVKNRRCGLRPGNCEIEQPQYGSAATANCKGSGLPSAWSQPKPSMGMPRSRPGASPAPMPSRNLPLWTALGRRGSSGPCPIAPARSRSSAKAQAAQNGIDAQVHAHRPVEFEFRSAQQGIFIGLVREHCLHPGRASDGAAFVVQRNAVLPMGRLIPDFPGYGLRISATTFRVSEDRSGPCANPSDGPCALIWPSKPGTARQHFASARQALGVRHLVRAQRLPGCCPKVTDQQNRRRQQDSNREASRHAFLHSWFMLPAGLTRETRSVSKELRI